jgi:hypothetical protein
VGWHRPARLQQQHGEHRALLGGAEVNRVAVPQHAYVAQNLETQRRASVAVGHRDTS